MKKMLPLVLSTVIVLILGYLLVTRKNEKSTIYINEKEIRVLIADNNFKRSQGLMRVKSLPENEGMFFIFDKEDKHTFWMKDTYIYLDIIWIDSFGKIVYIKDNVPPCDQKMCPIYIPDSKAKYVLEVNGGWVKKNNISIGDHIDF